MGKKEKIVLILCFVVGNLFAQEPRDSTFVRSGLMNTFGCFAFDYRMNQNAWDYRLHGFLEYFAEKHISAMGELYYYLDSDEDFRMIQRNISVGTGMAYHWPVKNMDTYIFCISTGSFYESRDIVDSVLYIDKMTTEPNPGIAIGGGVTLYVWKYLNFFTQFRYHRTLIYSPIRITNINTLSVSFGLGFCLHTRKK